MNENPRDPQQPDPGPADDAPADHFLGPNDPTPRASTSDATPGSAAGTDATAATTRIDEPVAPASERGRGVLKPILVGSAAALTVLAIAGVGMTIADAVGDDDPSTSPAATSAPVASGAPAPTDGPAGSEPGDDRGGDHSGDDSGDRSDDGDGHGDDGGHGDDDGLVDGAASSAPADLVSAIDVAIAAAGGGSATSIEVEQGGWKVDVRLDDGSELDVRVPVSGDAVVREDDHDDRSSDVPLDASRIADIVGAAVAAAGGGSVMSIETEDDGARFEVEVEVNGASIDVDLADDLSVVSVGD